MSDRLNTIFGWVLFAGIIALGLTALSSRIFHADKPEAPEKPGYFIEAAEEGGAVEEGPALATLLAEGSAEAGAAVFAKCASCHTINQGGANGQGPNLYGVLGTPIGKHAPGFAYSSDLANHGGNWDYENMDAWLKSPRAFAAGTKMSFAGLGKAEDRANLILYMRENGGGPALPTPEAAPAEGEAAAEGDAPAADVAAGAEQDAAAAEVAETTGA